MPKANIEVIVHTEYLGGASMEWAVQRTVPCHPFAAARSVLSAAPAAWSGFASALEAAATAPSQDRYWDLMRRQFPLEERLTERGEHLPGVALGSGSLSALPARLSIQPLVSKSGKILTGIRTVALELAAMLGAGPDEIALTRNTSECSATIRNGRLGVGL